jgi:hypothetical protein
VLHKPVSQDRLVNTVLKLIERDSAGTARPAGD